MFGPVDLVFDAFAKSISGAEYAEMLAKQAQINAANAKQEEDAAYAFFSGEQWGDDIAGPIHIRPAYDSTLVTPELTRFDPSTNTRVPVTQEWVDEAVAEIVRLNIELSAMPGSDPGVALQEVDRIWEAVRAASAV